MTTIEQLDEKRGNISSVSYDMGKDFNWKFVLGANRLLWWIPIDWGIGASMGDGVVISKKDIENSPNKEAVDGEFNYNDWEDQNEPNWNADEANDPLNKYGSILNAQNPLIKRVDKS